MTTKAKKKETKENNKSGAEKPVSVWGASFTDVLSALLKTKPMPKDEEKNGGKKANRSKTRR